MRRSRYGGYRKPRTKKLRPAIKVVERISKKGGRCKGCQQRFGPGTPITVVVTKQRKYHTGTCVPVNVGQAPSATGGGPIAPTPIAVVSALSHNWTIGEAKLVAIQALENVMVVIGKNSDTITPAQDKSLDRFMKVKSMFLNPGSDQEANQAAKLAVLEVVKTFF